MIINEIHNSLINSQTRRIEAKVEQLNGSTFSHNDDLISFDVERVGEKKFFGFGIVQKANIKLIDAKREKEFTTADKFNIYFGDLKPFPTFKVSEVHRDENDNHLSITLYDDLKRASSHYMSEVSIPPNYDDEGNLYYNIAQYISGICTFMGWDDEYAGGLDSWHSTHTILNEQPNFEGTETIREALDDIAEYLLAIYYLDSNNKLVFKRINKDAEPVITIDKSKYFTLNSKTNRRISAICNATELGDNVTATLDTTGTTVYIRDNAFWGTYKVIDQILNDALNNIGGLTINQFDCSWRGNYLIEPGDKIALTTKDNNTVTSYVLDDVISYNGSLTQKTQWSYENTEETASNPATLGDALKQTFAKVDKANKEISLVASKAEANESQISAIKLNTDSINATVSSFKEATEGALEGINGELVTINNKVEATITSEDVQLQIKSELSNGVDKVTTATGFTFNEDGLTVSKTGSEMTTNIDEDGMSIYRDNVEVLVADNTGVVARNLHAETYLIIGNNSRFEDYTNTVGEARTGCFWIGG